MTHLVVMAAGTGGHIIPGLAVAREMRARGWTVSWLGTVPATPGGGLPGLAKLTFTPFAVVMASWLQ